MKRFLAAFLVLLLLPLLPAEAFAQEETGEPQLIVSLEQAEPGDTVSLTVSLVNNPGFMALNPKFEYDQTRLKLLGTEDGVLKNWMATEKAAVWLGDRDTHENGVILKLIFQVLAEAPRGLAEVRLICGDGDAYNYNEELVVFRLVSGGVQIGEPDHEHSPAAPVRENDVPPTCTGTGSYDEVIYCEQCGAEISRIATVIPPTGHSYAAPVFQWEADYSGVWAVFTCEAKDDVKTLAAELTTEVVSENEDGSVTEQITATVELDGAVFRDCRERTIVSADDPPEDQAQPTQPGSDTAEQAPEETSLPVETVSEVQEETPSIVPEEVRDEQEHGASLALILLPCVLVLGLGFFLFRLFLRRRGKRE